jgi:hypothetical protein
LRRPAAAIVAIAACLVAVALGGCGQQGAKSTRGTTVSGGCDRHATPASFASQVAAATPGQRVCLGAGDYGTWTGTDKAITIAPDHGVSPQMSFEFGATASGFTIDGGHTRLNSRSPGIDLGPSSFDPGSKNITVKNTAATGHGAFFVLDIRTDGPGIVIKGNVFHDLEYPNTTSGAVRVLNSGRVGAANVVIEGNLFRDMGADAIDPGSPATIIGNDFSNVNSTAKDPRHTDVIQIGGPGGEIIEGNFIHNGCIQGIDAFDGTANNTITDNVIVGCTVHSLVMAGDTPGSTVAHNTIVGSPGGSLIECGSKPGEGPSVTRIVNNISQGGIASSGVPCKPSQDSHNMFFSGAASPNLNGMPRFVGGAHPTTYAGYALMQGSPGKGAADDGLDTGARVDRYRKRAP